MPEPAFYQANANPGYANLIALLNLAGEEEIARHLEREIRKLRGSAVRVNPRRRPDLELVDELLEWQLCFRDFVRGIAVAGSALGTVETLSRIPPDSPMRRAVTAYFSIKGYVDDRVLLLGRLGTEDPGKKGGTHRIEKQKVDVHGIAFFRPGRRAGARKWREAVTRHFLNLCTWEAVQYMDAVLTADGTPGGRGARILRCASPDCRRYALVDSDGTPYCSPGCAASNKHTPE
jgi:hypothetical protein